MAAKKDLEEKIYQAICEEVLKHRDKVAYLRVGVEVLKMGKLDKNSSISVDEYREAMEPLFRKVK